MSPPKTSDEPELLSAEGAGNTLMVYRRSQQVAPTEISSFLGEASGVLSVFGN